LAGKNGEAPQGHGRFLRNFALYFGKVMDADELIAALSKHL